MSAEDNVRSKLHTEAARLGHELLGDWYIRPAVRNAWQPVPLELFPNFQMRSIAEVANEGIAPEQLNVALARNGHRAHWPNPDIAEEFLLQVPSRGRPFDEQLTELRQVHDRIRVIDELRTAQLKGTPLEETIDKLEALRPRVDEQPIEPLPVVSVEDLFADLGPEPWVCERLALQPGNPLMLSGNSGTGKSWITTDFTLAVASGQPFSGFPVRRGKVRWLHLEGSSRDLKGRTQKLARARQLGPDELRGWFFASSHPRFNFQDRALERLLVSECEGFTVAVIDTFAVAAAGMNENDSAIRQPLDMLARVSERTGCAFIVIHHQRKDSQDPKAQVDPEMQIRGSSALNNAISVGWSTKKLPRGQELYFHTRLVMGKSWYGKRADLICGAYASSFVPGGVDLYVRDATDRDDEPPAENHAHLDQEILDAVSARPGVSLSGLSELLGKRRPLIAGRVRALEADRRVTVDAGPRGAWTVKAVPLTGAGQAGPT